MPCERNKTVEINELFDRVERLEAIIYTEDNIETAKALSKGAVSGTVNLMAELIELKHTVECMKEKINELIEVLNHG